MDVRALDKADAMLTLSSAL